MDDLSRARSEIFGPAIAELAEADELTALGAHLREEQSIRGKSIVVVAFSANFSASFSASSCPALTFSSYGERATWTPHRVSESTYLPRSTFT